MLRTTLVQPVQTFAPIARRRDLLLHPLLLLLLALVTPHSPNFDPDIIKGHRKARRDAASETRPRCHGPSLDCTAQHCKQRLEAYESDLDARDAALAAQLGLKTATFAMWRLRHELPARSTAPAYALRHPKWSILPPEEIARRRAAYDHPDWTEQQLATHLGITRNQVRHFRQHHGLPPHRKQGERSEQDRLGTGEDARRLAAYNALRGRADEEEAARALGLSKAAYISWRRRRGLPRTSTTTIPGVRSIRKSHVADALSETIRRLTAYLSAASDAKAADALSMSRDVYEKWRRRAGLISPRELRLKPRAQAKLRRQLDAARTELEQRGHADPATQAG